MGSGSVARSRGSCPTRTSARRAQSSTLRAKTPTVSRKGDCMRIPVRGIRPKLGFIPTIPQKAAGRITDPPVCVPMDKGTIPAATAAAEPCDEPPGVCAGLCGLRVLPGCMKAHSVVTVLPRMIAPAARRRATIQASSEGTRPASMGVPFSVGMPLVSMTSFRPTGRPCSGPSGLPDWRH